MPKGVFTPQVPVDNDELLGEGVFYINYGTDDFILGATMGNSKLEIEKEIKEIKFDGAYGPHKGLRRYTRYVPRFKINLFTLTYTSLGYACPVTVTDKGDYHEIAFNLNIEDTDYATNITFVGKKLDGKACIMIIENPLQDGNMTFDFKEKDEVAPELQYTGHYASTTPTTPPLIVREYAA
jgi:hypothetical protein